MVERVPARMLWLAAGFALWSSAFVTLYAIQSLGCAYDWSLVAHRGLLFAVLGAHLAALTWCIAHAPRGERRAFLSEVTLWTLWAAVVATVFTYAPALTLTACM